MITLTIDVTQEDIDNGQPMSATDDPFALAVRRLVGPLPVVFVEDTGIRLIENQAGGDIVVHGELPRSAREFIEAYDNGHRVHPMSFKIEFNDEVQT